MWKHGFEQLWVKQGLFCFCELLINIPPINIIWEELWSYAGLQNFRDKWNCNIVESCNIAWVEAKCSVFFSHQTISIRKIIQAVLYIQYFEDAWTIVIQYILPVKFYRISSV